MQSTKPTSEKVENTNDPRVLKNIILHDIDNPQDSSDIGDTKLRELALNRISDQKILEEIALSYGGTDPGNNKGQSSKRSYFILKAIEKINDQNILFNIAINGEKHNTIAVSKIEDQKLLEKIILKTDRDSAREIAAGKITNLRLLESIFFDKKEPAEVRNGAINSIARLHHDENILSEIVLSNGSHCVTERLYAIAGIRDTTILKMLLNTMGAPAFQQNSYYQLLGNCANRMEKYYRSQYDLGLSKGIKSYDRLNSLSDIKNYTIARLMAVEKSKGSDRRSIESILKENMRTNYKEGRVRVLSDILYIFEDPQLIKKMGISRIIMLTSNEQKRYGSSGFGQGAIVKIEDIYFNIIFKNRASIYYLKIKSKERGKSKETFYITPGVITPSKLYTAELSLDEFFDKFKVRLNDPVLFDELQKSNHYKKIMTN
ncbi:MAG: hypothetical protein KKE62_10425 [Proteobacteria bacterium]|nr:hypothetical protein [Pseudomonadota bacterium]MBU1386631.1 hypothetical protein [Pseudomonadota bacterium]MBU1543241.1 hypothetical protein [Pseudomonadota bacterium]